MLMILISHVHQISHAAYQCPQMLVVQNIQWLESLDFIGYFELEKEELLSGERYAAGVIYKWWKNQYLPFLV